MVTNYDIRDEPSQIEKQRDEALELLEVSRNALNDVNELVDHYEKRAHATARLMGVSIIINVLLAFSLAVISAKGLIE